jgi:hypothetical protein
MEAEEVMEVEEELSGLPRKVASHLVLPELVLEWQEKLDPRSKLDWL